MHKYKVVKRIRSHAPITDTKKINEKSNMYSMHITVVCK